MKLFNKKLIGLLVCLALVLAMLPMAVFAVDTYVLADGVTQTITIPVGESATIEVDATASDMNLLVNGNRMYYDWYVDTGRMQSYPNPGGVVETMLPAGGTYTLTLVNTSADAEQVVDVTASAPTVGTEDVPAELVMGMNSCSVEAWGAYFYSYTAFEDGALTLTIDTAAELMPLTL